MQINGIFCKNVTDTVEEFKENYSDRDVATYGYISSKEHSVNIDDTNYCHAGLLRGTRESEAIIDFLMSKDTYIKEEFVIFFNWLSNFSPWSDVFLEKDGDRVFKEGYFLVSTRYDRNYVSGALIANRFFSEYNNKTFPFKYLVENGIDGLIAFLICHCVSSADNKCYGTYGTDYHTPLSGSDTSVNNLVEMSNKKVPKTNTYYKNPRYNKIHEFACELSGDPIANIFGEVKQGKKKEFLKRVLVEAKKIQKTFIEKGGKLKGNFEKKVGEKKEVKKIKFVKGIHPVDAYLEGQN